MARDFRWLWVTAGLTTVGDAVTAVAVPLLAITHFHSSSLAVAVLVAADQAGWLLLGLPTGVWLDRIRVRRSVQSAYAVRGLGAAVGPGGIPARWPDLRPGACGGGGVRGGRGASPLRSVRDLESAEIRCSPNVDPPHSIAC